MAALFALRGAAVETVDTIQFNPLFHKLRIRKVDANRDAVAVAYAIQEVVGFIRKPASIEREDFDPPSVLGDHVEKNHVFKTKTARERTGTMLRFDLLQ